MRIGLISDTHGWLHPKVLHYFSSCQEIWHAGDVGNEEVIIELKKISPVVRFVFGNIDGQVIRRQSHKKLIFQIEGLIVAMTHIGGYPPRYNHQTIKWIKSVNPDLFICGHSHILKVIRDPEHKLLYVNPGAAGYHGFHKQATLVRFEINNKKISQMEVIDLGPRGKLPIPDKPLQ